MSPDVLLQSIGKIEMKTCIEFVPVAEDDKSFVNIIRTDPFNSGEGPGACFTQFAG